MEKKKTIRLGVSAAAFCVLLLRPLHASWLLAPAVTLLLFAALQAFRNNTEGVGKDHVKEKLHPAAVLLSVLLSVFFLLVWLRTKRLIALYYFEWRRALPILLAAVPGTAGAVPFLSALLNALHQSGSAPDRNRLRVQNGKSGGNDAGNNGGTCGGIRGGSREIVRFSKEEKRLLFCTALVTVTICSLSSPLYPFNDWVDTNCFFTVGKSMFFGVVPYRDLYEQKGPLLYMLYALGYPLSHRSFLGGWILEILAAWWFLSLAWRCHALLTGKKDPKFLFLTAAIVYTVPAFLKGGSAEELTLPLIMLSAWYGLRCVYRKEDLSGREAFFIGLSSGAVLWIKYSMLGFYLGFILVPAYRMLREKKGLRLLKLLGLIALGVAASSLPILTYFGANGAIPDLWEAYFFNNIFVYGKASSVFNTVKGLASGFMSMLTYNDVTILLFLLAVTVLWRRGERALTVHVFLCFGFAFGLVYAGGINMKYYSEILCVFVPLGVTMLLSLCGTLRHGAETAAVAGSADRETGLPVSADATAREKHCESGPAAGARKGKRERLARILIPVLFTLTLFGSENSGMLFHKRAEMPQFVFAETLKDSPDATLFNYGALDIGLFTTADIVPSTRYFCMLNLPSEEMVAEMERYMADGVTDYIVSRGLEVESPCYTLLQTVYFPDNGTLYPYYLYKRSESNANE